ncbi:DUF664 domain-containing protein [Brachybacterium endophyticum]|nr:DUF664 domain-containing protein [Brachybacterium endophyticum]
MTPQSALLSEDAAASALLDALDAERAHVLATVRAIGDADATRVIPPVTWSITRMLGKLTFDDEIFWIGAVLSGNAEAISSLRNGWTDGATSLPEALDDYQRAVESSRSALESFDPSAPPRWTPPPDVFGGAVPATQAALVTRVLVETATHAGHLDIVRESIDGHRHLVVS